MKQIFYSVLLSLLMSMAANVAFAYDAEIDGIYYNFNGTEATVTSGKYTGDVVIPGTVTYNETDYSVVCIGSSAFANCSGLTFVTIPNSVTSIGNGAFYGCSSLNSITIPNSVTSIEHMAFANCSDLTTITIGNSVVSIGNTAFNGCSNLATIVVEEGNTMYDSRNNCNAIIQTLTNTLEVGCKNTTIPNTVREISSYAFYGCSDLASVTIPSSVTGIGGLAFSGCSNLTSIMIPSSVTLISNDAFSGCSGLTTIIVEEGNTKYDSRGKCNAIIESSSNTFLVGCKNTTIINSVTSIGNSAFSGCSGLTSITIPDNVTSIGNSAFSGCSGLASITIPDNVTSIGKSAFEGCSGLTSITIPDSVTSIGDYAFWKCSSLNCVTIPNGVTTIGGSAFWGCTSLTSITIPNGVTSIGTRVFSNCSGLISVTIPNSVTTIGNWAFAYCGLKDIYCYSENVPTINSDSFWGTSIGNVTLHVPTSSINAYKTTAPWSDFKEIVESDYLNVTDLNIKAGASNTQEISLNNGLTNFVAFQMDLTLPEGVGIDKTGCVLSDRITDNEQELTIGKLESGAYRITSTSLSLTPISGNDGTLLNLKLTAEDGCIGGQATINNIIFSTSESEMVVMSDKTFDISVLYNLTYKVDGQEYKDTTIFYGTALTLEAEPTKEGYTFSGWSELPETMPNHDVTVTGSFMINKYLLTYKVDGEIFKADSIVYNSALTPLAEPTKEGYTFSGWSEIPETMPAKDVVVTGTFKINKYLLTYKVDGEIFKADSIVYNSALTPIAEPTKEGYTFSGWSEIPETMPAHDVVVTGSFKINKYLLTYKVDGEIVKSDSIVYNSALTAMAEPTKEGYTFSGWSEIPATMPAHDVTISGTFSINSYKLTYMMDEKVYKDTLYEYGATIVPEPIPAGNYLSFEWVGLPKTMPARDVMVYADYKVSGITDVMKPQETTVFSPNGKRLNKPQKGLNIIRMSNGKTKKVVIK